jgi:ethanolamine ammonia-lyase large subunit
LLAFDLIFQELSFIVLDRAMKSRREEQRIAQPRQAVFQEGQGSAVASTAERDVGTRVTSSKEFKLEN